MDDNFRDQDVRAMAVHAGPSSAPRAHSLANEYGSWFDFVATMGDLTPAEAEVRSHIGAFLGQLEITPMTRSYKMLVLLAMLGDDAFPGSLDLGRLTERFADLARRYASIRQDLGETLEDDAALRRLIVSNDAPGSDCQNPSAWVILWLPSCALVGFAW